MEKSYKVCVRIGEYEMTTNEATCNNGFAMWSIEKSLVASFYENQDIPDIFVYLVDHHDKKLCFSRFPAILGQVLEDKWIELKPDLSVIQMKS